MSVIWLREISTLIGASSWVWPMLAHSFSMLMDAGHSFVGLAIAVQMLAGVRYAEDVLSSLCTCNKHTA